MNPPSFRATVTALAEQRTALLVGALLFDAANGLVTIVRGSLVPDHGLRTLPWRSPAPPRPRTRGPQQRVDERHHVGGVRLREEAGALSAVQKRLLSVIVSFSRFI